MISVYPELGRTEWITSQRPARARLNPTRPHGFFLERELAASGTIVSSAVILLTNKECPWRCLMCDLWKNTLSHTVPLGAIPAQIDYALERLGSRPEQIKLYNSGSFFDPAAIPIADYALISKTVSFANRVIVECHPRLVGRRAVEFRNLLNRTRLEVALGLETVHPIVLPRLNKKFDLGHFERAALFLRENRMDLRVFILVKPPFLREDEATEWAVRSADFAFDCGATAVSLIPTRGGNGAMERLIEAGEFSLPNLSKVEQAFEACLVRFSMRKQGGAGEDAGEQEIRTGRRVFVDCWDLEQFSKCSHCFEQRRTRLEQMNLTQRTEPALHCPFCGGS